MENTGNILKKFRKNRNLTQKALCEGIITRQTYSKIENNLLETSFKTLTLLLNKMDYEISDFIIEINKFSESKSFYDNFLKGISGDLKLNEAELLFEYADKEKHNGTKEFHLYGIVKGHLHNKFPTVIPNYNQTDKNIFKSLLDSINDFYSLYDLKIIGDFAAHLLSTDEIITLYHKLPEFDPYAYGEDSEIYRKQVHRIYNNFSDILIDKNELNLAKEIINKHKKFIKIHSDLRFNLYIKINEILINFKESNDNSILDELHPLISFLKSIGEYNTARAIQYQFDILRSNKTYDTTKSISYD